MESWKGKRINFDINYLRKTFEIGDKYKQYTDFRKRIINPSIEVLNNTGKFNISYEEIKQGRKVISIDFIVEDLEPREYFNIIENEKVEIKKEELIQPV
ncbi:MAG: replication initiation protein, partial [Cetobacterium sp.]